MFPLLYILAAYIAIFTIAMYKLEHAHGRANMAAPNDREDTDHMLLRALYMTLPTCYYLTLLYVIWYIGYHIAYEQPATPKSYGEFWGR